MDKTQAQMLREAHNAYVKRINRMSRASLADLERQELADRGIVRVMGGPVTRDELISSLCELRYPATALNEATHVLYHQPGESWSACRLCQCQETRITGGYVEQCVGAPGHAGDHFPPDNTFPAQD